jgi:hypothetical protein
MTKDNLITWKWKRKSVLLYRNFVRVFAVVCYLSLSWVC